VPVAGLGLVTEPGLVAGPVPVAGSGPVSGPVPVAGSGPVAGPVLATGSGPVWPGAAAQGAQGHVPPARSGARGKYSSMGGVLLFVEVCFIYSVLVNVAALFMNLVGFAAFVRISGLTAALFAATEALTVAAIVLNIMLVAGLAGRKPRFLLVYHISVIVALASNVILYFYDKSTGGLVMPFYTTAYFLALMCWTVMCTPLLTLYFVKSVRVRTYMGTDAYIKGNPLTKNMRPPKPLY
jgi:hypothetical protein